jgi:tRNA pseudouridine38-40 synthase
LTRFKLTIEYDGTGFVGWQRQDNGPSVQAAVEEAIRRFSGETVSTLAGGRTDAGVHALGQVIHFDLTRGFAARTVRDALNAHLRPQPVAVLEAEEVAADFHARFSALERAYRYRILARRAPPALERGRVWHVAKPLNVAAMSAAARLLVGHHDFTSFRAAACQARSPIKTLDELEIVRAGEEVRVHARARSFLHHMVRNIVGTLALVGEAKWSAADVAAALAARDRAAAGPTAPAAGLYLVRIAYPAMGAGQAPSARRPTPI